MRSKPYWQRTNSVTVRLLDLDAPPPRVALWVAAWALLQFAVVLPLGLQSGVEGFRADASAVLPCYNK